MIKFFKVLSLPEILEANSLYLVKTAVGFGMYTTSADEPIIASKIDTEILTHNLTGFIPGTLGNWSVANQTITLTGTVEAYFEGKKVEALTTGWVSEPHPDVRGHIYYLYYDGTNFVWADNTFPGFDVLLISVVHYRVSNPFAINEFHGFMQNESHMINHYNTGTYRVSGGDVSGLTLNSTVAANRRPDISSCLIQDEDLPTTNAALTSKLYTQRFITNTNTVNYTINAADIVPLLADRPYYNQYNGSTFVQTLMPNNSIMTVWLFEVPVTKDDESQLIRHVFVQGQSITQATSGNTGPLLTARNTEKLKTSAELVLGDTLLISMEYVCIHKYIIQYTNNNWTITDETKLLGNRVSQLISPTGQSISSVERDATLTGAGTVASPLGVDQTEAANLTLNTMLDYAAWKNLLNIDLVVDNYYYDNNGCVIPFTGYSSTGKQVVLPSTQYSFWKTTYLVTQFDRLHFWDANNNYLGNNISLGNSTIINGCYTFTTPSNCYFVGTWVRRVGSVETFKQFKNSLQLELGAKTTYSLPGPRIREKYALQEYGAYTNTEIDALIISTDTSLKTTIIEETRIRDNNLINTLPLNSVVGEGGINPSFLNASNGSGLTQTLLDNDSLIYPTHYLKKRRFKGTVSSGNCFKVWSGLTYPSPYPTTISFRFWIKDADIPAIFTSDSLGILVFLLDTAAINFIGLKPTVAIRTTGLILGNTFSAAGKMSGSYKIMNIEKVNGYSCLAITWYNLIYDPAYVATTFSLYFDFATVAATFNTRTLDMIGFTWLFNNEATSPYVYPDSAGKLQYPPTLLSLNTDVTTVKSDMSQFENEVTSLLSKPTRVLLSGNYVYVRTSFNATTDLVQKFIVFGTANYANLQLNFSEINLILKTKLDTVTDYTTDVFARLSAAGDDSCPNNYNGTYIGGAHGCNDVLVVTATNHGKTTEDIGSEWTDNTDEKFYIVKIVDANTLWILSEDMSSDDTWLFNLIIEGSTLTHSANATHTGNITVSSYVRGQLIPATKNNVISALLDGETSISTDGVYTCDFLDLVNDYDIINPSSVLDLLIAAVGTTYTDAALATVYRSGDKSLNNQILLRIQNTGALLVMYGWRPRKYINFDHMGFMQAEMLSSVTYPKMDLYMPKALPISDGSKTWDFRTVEDYNVAPATTLFISSAYFEDPESPPERTIEYLSDINGVHKVGFAMGYDLSKGDVGSRRKDLVSIAYGLYATRKIYPYGLDTKINPVVADTWFSMVGYRIFFDVESTDKGSATNLYHYKVGDDVIIIFDYHSLVDFDVLKIPSEYVGLNITVVEKSDNIVIHNTEVMQNGITVSVLSGDYGYCTLRLSDAEVMYNQIDIASAASVTPTGNKRENELFISALATEITINNPSGTANKGNTLLVRIKDNGTARVINWGNKFRGLSQALPLITITGKEKYLGFIYNSAAVKWDLINVINEI